MEYEFIEHLGGMDISMFMVNIFRRQTHFHSDIELLIAVSGSVLIDVGGKRYTVREGDVFIINKNESHSLLRSDTENALLVMQFNPHFSNSYYNRLSRIRILQRHITKEFMPRLRGEVFVCFAYILRNLNEKRQGYQLALMSALNYLSLCIVRHGIYDVPSADRLSREEKERSRIAAIVDYMQQNYMNKPLLSELAERQKLDMSYLSHFIKNTLGIGFREYVNRLRLERAVELIANTNMRLLDVCVDCGYSDYRYLNKAFLGEFGVTPIKFREGFRKRRRSSPIGARMDEQHSVTNIGEVYGALSEYLNKELNTIDTVHDIWLESQNSLD